MRALREFLRRAGLILEMLALMLQPGVVL